MAYLRLVASAQLSLCTYHTWWFLTTERRVACLGGRKTSPYTNFQPVSSRISLFCSARSCKLRVWRETTEGWLHMQACGMHRFCHLARIFISDRANKTMILIAVFFVGCSHGKTLHQPENTMECYILRLGSLHLLSQGLIISCKIFAENSCHD